jgi:glucose-1-phosphate thymidylyltransferase
MTGDRIVELVETPSEEEYRLQNRGVYVLGPSIFPAIEETDRRDGEIPLTDAIADLIERTSEVQGVRAPGIWSEATYPWNLLTVARDIMTEGLIGLPERAPQTWIAETATVHDAAILQPPVIVDDDAVVGPGSIVGPYTALGTNVTVQAGTVIRRSVLDSHARVGTNATVLDSVTGEGAEIGAGVTIPDGPGTVQIQDTVHQECDLGSVVADRATLGGAVSVAPGTLVGPHATVAHGTHLDTNVADSAEVRR